MSFLHSYSVFDLLFLAILVIALLFGLFGKGTRKIFRLIFVVVAIVLSYFSVVTVVSEAIDVTPTESGLTSESVETTFGDIAESNWIVKNDKDEDYELTSAEHSTAINDFMANTFRVNFHNFLAPQYADGATHTEDPFLGQLYESSTAYKSLVDNNLYALISLFLFWPVCLVNMILIPLFGMIIVDLFTIGKKRKYEKDSDGKRRAVQEEDKHGRLRPVKVKRFRAWKTLGIPVVLRVAIVAFFFYLPLLFVTPLIESCKDNVINEDNMQNEEIASACDTIYPYLVMVEYDKDKDGNSLTEVESINLFIEEQITNSYVLTFGKQLLSSDKTPLINTTYKDGEETKSYNFYEEVLALGDYIKAAGGMLSEYDEIMAVIDSFGGDNSDTQKVDNDVNDGSNPLVNLSGYSEGIKKIIQIVGPYLEDIDEARSSHNTPMNSLISGILNFVVFDYDWGYTKPENEEDKVEFSLKHLSLYLESLVANADLIKYAEYAPNKNFFDGVDFETASFNKDILPRLLQCAILWFADGNVELGEDFESFMPAIGNISFQNGKDEAGNPKFYPIYSTNEKDKTVVSVILDAVDSVSNLMKMMSGSELSASDVKLENIGSLLDTLIPVAPGEDASEEEKAEYNQKVTELNDQLNNMIPQDLKDTLGLSEENKLDIVSEQKTISAIVELQSGAELDSTSAREIADSLCDSALIDMVADLGDGANEVVSQCINEEQADAIADALAEKAALGADAEGGISAEDYAKYMALIGKGVNPTE